MIPRHPSTALLLLALTPAALAGSRNVVVNSLEDSASPPAGTVTLRAALAAVRNNGRITFDPALDGGTIELSIVGEEHSVLMAEMFPMGQFAGYGERDYGRSALYARKNVTIDAADLPHGIELAWTGGDTDRARVLAVYGDLTLRNVTIRGGYASAEPISGGTQPYTLARGGGLAVWGTARLERCTLAGNRTDGDPNASRDRGSFGGGIYGDRIIMSDCVVSGNWARGYGAAGGGVYSVGGEGTTGGSTLERCAITGNRVTAQHAYGGGVYSDGGGPGSSRTLTLENCTVARNVVEDHPEIGEPAGSQYYYRGGGVYMSNGSLAITSCTVVENDVSGIPAIFRGRPNMGGGAIAATIGDAHVVEQMELAHSIVAGNRLNGVASDVFTGSLIHFQSYGHNRVGAIDFDQMLVPIPPWWSLSRRHWPKVGDEEGTALDDVVVLAEIERHPWIVSQGTDAGQPAVLWYPPAGSALDQVPKKKYRVRCTLAQQVVHRDGEILNLVLERLRTDYAAQLGSEFGSDFGDMSGVTFVPIPREWPSDPGNADWIQFWHDLDAELDGRLGSVGLGDEFWSTFKPDPGETGVKVSRHLDGHGIRLAASDQLGQRRPAGAAGDIGAVER
ncbi:MAG: right-handed parallel beta-helix repeat-containing protein [Acidobacteria bacterium]|nr:right-handed parallel beta-helix repeat-containing protein [Acidobacteriota bacterium]